MHSGIKGENAYLEPVCFWQVHTYPDNDAALTMQRREDVELPSL